MKVMNNTIIRCHYLDWLRVIAIIAVFVYHSVHFFDTGYWSIKNSSTYKWISELMNLLDIWLMPLIFLISGASIFFTVEKNKPMDFIRSKVMRLLLPLLVSIFSFSIMQVYLERVFFENFKGSFIQFLPFYFEGIYLPGTAGNFAIHGMHLWYLLFLFIFSLLFMPLFWLFKGKTGFKVLQKTGDILAFPGALILITVPTIIIQNITNTMDVFENGGWQIIHYPWFFLSGYLIASNPKIQLRMAKTRWIWLALTLTYILRTLFMQQGLDTHQDILVWLLLFTIFGFAIKSLNFSNSFLEYSNEAVMPFYVLHQNVLLLLGFFIVKWYISDVMKYMFIVLFSLFIIMFMYHYLIRYNNVLRIIFGMKPIAKMNLDTTVKEKAIRVGNPYN